MVSAVGPPRAIWITEIPKNVAFSLVRYLKEAREELRKVVWPKWPETRNNTLLVIGISAFVALFLGLIDLGLDFIMQSFVIR